MKLSTVLAGRTFTFQSVKEVLAKANEEKSGDILAGVAAASGLERVAAKQVLSELLVRDLRENPVVPYVVPPGGLPLAAGAVVDNIATIYAISQAMEGIPFTQKIFTVTGEVTHPVVLSVPVGTSFRACLEPAGGPLTHRYCVVSGGPMMGRTLTKEEAEEAFVTKTTSGILVPPEEEPQGRARAVEIPLKMHIGAPCLPLVAPGDSVRAGSSSPSRRKAPWGR